MEQEGPLEVWVKPLSDGSKAVALFNRGWGAAPVTVNLADLGLRDSVAIHDLWAKKELGVFKGQYTSMVPQHGAVMIKVK